MESDRELLELAAKAAGYLLEWRWLDSDFTHGDYYPFIGKAQGWNPFTDDGDALRLAVNLKIAVSFNEPEEFCVSVFWPDAPGWKFEQATMGYPVEEVTRRAIVRAAAEIGRRMKDADKERK